MNYYTFVGFESHMIWKKVELKSKIVILNQLNILLSHSTTLDVLKLQTKSIKHTQFKFTNSKEFPNIIFYATSNMQCLIYFWLLSSVTIYILIITKQMQENQLLQKYFFLINFFIFITLKKICTIPKTS